MIVYTDSNGIAQVNLTVGMGASTYLVYYPGDNGAPRPYEPTSIIIVLNTSIAPWIVVEPNVVEAGSWLRVYGCGYPPYTPIDILVDGLRVTRIYSNATGCIDYRIALPYNIPLGDALLKAVDAQYPHISASARIIVAGNRIIDAHRLIKGTYGLALTVKDYIIYLNNEVEKMLEMIHVLRHELEVGFNKSHDMAE